jgi:hypothetical protein
MNYYKAVSDKSLIASALDDYVVRSAGSDWIDYYNFKTLPVPQYVLAYDPVLLRLAEEHEFHAGVLRMDPLTCYNWHVDTTRKVSLNMLLRDNADSLCLFLSGKPGVSFEVHKLQYKPDTYYVFNTQIPHMVLNQTGYRYLFSIEFLGKSRNLDYQTLCDFFEVQHA